MTNRRLMLVACMAVFSLGISFIVIAPNASAAVTRYLVLNATGCLSGGVRDITSNGNCWSNTSGGAGGAGVPTIAMDAVLNSASGFSTGTIGSTTLSVHSWNAAGFMGRIQYSTNSGVWSPQLYVNGDFVSGGTFNGTDVSRFGLTIMTVNGNASISNGSIIGGFGCLNTTNFYGITLTGLQLRSFATFNVTWNLPPSNATFCKVVDSTIGGLTTFNNGIAADDLFTDASNITGPVIFDRWNNANNTLGGITRYTHFNGTKVGTFEMFATAPGNHVTVQRWNTYHFFTSFGAADIVTWQMGPVNSNKASIRFTFFDLQGAQLYYLCEGASAVNFGTTSGTQFVQGTLQLQVTPGGSPPVPLWLPLVTMSVDLYGCPSPPHPTVLTGSTVKMGSLSAFGQNVATNNATNIGQTTAHLQGSATFSITQDVNITDDELVSLPYAGAPTTIYGQFQTSSAVSQEAVYVNGVHITTPVTTAPLTYADSWRFVPACQIQMYRAVAFGGGAFGTGAWITIPMGCAGATFTAWFNWGDTPALGNTTTAVHPNAIVNGTTFGTDITGLVANHTYYFQATVQWPTGQIFSGPVLSFKTSASPPVPPPQDLLGPAINLTWILVYIAILTLMLYGAFWLKRRREGSGGSL